MILLHSITQHRHSRFALPALPHIGAMLVPTCARTATIFLTLSETSRSASSGSDDSHDFASYQPENVTSWLDGTVRIGQGS